MDVSLSLPPASEFLQQCQSAKMDEVLLHCLQSKASETEIVGLLTTTFESLVKVESQDEDERASYRFLESTANAIWLLYSMQSAVEPPPVLVACTRAVAAVGANLIRPYLLQTLEPILLEQAGVLKQSQPALTTDTFFKKIRTFNTLTFYKQQKFNLLAEESEGYAKLLALTTKSSSTDTAPAQCRNLISVFHLDPNRCLSLLLHLLTQTFEDKNDENERKETLLGLIRSFHPTDKIPPLLHFQLQQQQLDDATTEQRDAVLQCMTWLSRQTAAKDTGTPLLSQKDMWCYLWGPEEKAMLEEKYKEAYKLEFEKVKALGRVSLSGKPSSSGDGNVLDLSGLLESNAIKWLAHLLHHECWDLVDEDETWSQLFFLFPEHLGVPACAQLRRRLNAAVSDTTIVLTPLWCQPKVSEDEMRQEMALPSLSCVLDIVETPLRLMTRSGCIASDPALYSQLCRILSSLNKEKSESESDRFDRFLQNFLIPSLCLFSSNPALSHEVWAVIECISYRRRYNLYSTWRGLGLEKAALRQPQSKPLWLIRAELEAGKAARYALRRLSKDTVRDSSRSVAKVCYNNPLVVFTTILNQIESYDNLVGVMVDALRYVTPLSLDVLGFCILSRLSGSANGGLGVNRSRLKDDGVNVSQWLQSLESFAGEFYKRFSTIESRGIFGYLMHRLKEGQVMELGVLRNLLKTAGGWTFADYAPAASLSDGQLKGRAGSTALQRETASFGVHVEGAMNEVASKHLRNVLQEQDMGVILLILLAQVRHQIVYETGEQPKPVKLVGNLFDTCQVTMSILLDFLTNPDTGKKPALLSYARSLPPLLDLLNVYKMDVASAWMLSRPLFQASEHLETDTHDKELQEAIEPYAKSDDFLESIEVSLPKDVRSDLSATLFVSFFSHSLYDLYCPKDVYVSEISRLDKEAERISKGVASQQSMQNTTSVTNTKDESKELTRVKKVSESLGKDLNKHTSHVQTIRTDMDTKKDRMFPAVVSEDSMATFFTHCIYPRCMQGPDDAMYCAKYVLQLHEMNTPGFSTMHFFDCAFLAFSRCIYGLTEGEAANVSIFLAETWKIVSEWRYAENAFATIVEGKPGCVMASQDPIFAESEPEGEEKGLRKVTSREFESLYNKWHAAIGATSLGALKSKEYMHQRCCLIVLSRMVEMYPTRPKTGNQLLKALEPLQDESNSLANIRAAAQAYSMQLLKARDDRVWKEEDAATVKAREDKEQAAAAARQKKAEEQMEEMKRESERITSEMGEWRGRANDHRTPSSRDDGGRRGRSQLPPPGREEARRPSGRERGTSGSNYSSMGRRGGAENFGGGRRDGDMDGRWQPRGGSIEARAASSGTKRSRPPSPSEGESPSKRARGPLLEPGEEAPRGGDDRRRRPRSRR